MGPTSHKQTRTRSSTQSSPKNRRRPQVPLLILHRRRRMPALKQRGGEFAQRVLLLVVDLGLLEAIDEVVEGHVGLGLLFLGPLASMEGDQAGGVFSEPAASGTSIPGLAA